MDAQDQAAMAVSKHDLETQVRDYLFESRIPMLRNVEVEACGGRVTLRGRVRRYYYKQLCLSFCLRVAGVRDVDDQIVVESGNRLAGLISSDRPDVGNHAKQ